MPKILNLTGSKFGKLFVIRRGENKGPSMAWECLCDCGKHSLVRTAALTSGSTQSCGCMSRSNGADLTGRRFGRYTVLGLGKREGKLRTWECRCDCGEHRTLRTQALTSGSSKSCGCLCRELTGNRVRRPVGEAAFFNLYGSYKRRALRSGREFTLTQDQARQLFSGTCHYCGAAPVRRHHLPNMNGAFVYNGIDRVDNSIGYTLKNSVTCCATCNLAKRDLSYSEFLDWVESVHAYRKRAA